MTEQGQGNAWKDSKEYAETVELLKKTAQAEPSKIIGVSLAVYAKSPDRMIDVKTVSWFNKPNV